jgi:hypothetical protein
MASGAAPAFEPKGNAETETTEARQPQPATLKQRIKLLLHEIFEGHEEYLGWHQ